MCYSPFCDLWFYVSFICQDKLHRPISIYLISLAESKNSAILHGKEKILSINICIYIII